MNGDFLNNKSDKQNMFKFLGPKKNKYFLIILILIWLAIISIYYGPKLLTYFGGPPTPLVGEVHLGLYPETATYKQGDSIPVIVRLDTAQKNIVAVRAIIKYNQNIFTATGISFTGSAFSDSSCTGGICFTENIIDSANGEIRIAVGKPTILTVRGVNASNATVATINFTVKTDAAPGTYSLTLDQQTTQQPTGYSSVIEDNINACPTPGEVCTAGADLLVNRATQTHSAVFTIQAAAYNPDVTGPDGIPDGRVDTIDATRYIYLWRQKDVLADVDGNKVVDTIDATQYIYLWRQAQ